jgi:CheY-like chemotaxis protein
MSRILKIGLSLVLVALASTRFLFYEQLSERMDLIFLALVLSVFLLWMLPWEEFFERASMLRVGGVEISLRQREIQETAIERISFAEVHLHDQLALSTLANPEEVKDRLRQRLKSLEGELPTVRGTRVLWIDDHPETLLGERRLLRAFGIDITPATTSEEANDTLRKDNDFDLIITDVFRSGRLEGVDFVVILRKEKDARIRNLPVIFYVAYRWERLVEITRPARVLLPEAAISNTIDDFIPKVIRMLSEERRNPITFGSRAYLDHISP